jgi:hypothetical protein
LRWYQDFKWDVVAGLDHLCWELTSPQIDKWFRARLASKPAAGLIAPEPNGGA